MNLERPLIIIKPNYYSNNEYIVLNLGKITLKRGVIKEEIGSWIERTEVFMKEMDLIIYKDSRNEEILKKFEVNALIGRVKGSFEVKMRLSPLIINLKNSYLRLLQRILNQNLMKMKKANNNRNLMENKENSINLKGNNEIIMKFPSFKVQIDLESINLFLIEEDEDFHLLLIPICTFMFRSIRTILSYKENQKRLSFIGNSLIGSYFLRRNPSNLEEYTLIGQIQRKRTHSLDIKGLAYINEDYLKSSTLKQAQKQFEIEGLDIKGSSFVLEYIEDAKIRHISVNFNSLQINLMLDLLLKINKLFLLEEIISKEPFYEKKEFLIEKISKENHFKVDLLDCCLSLACPDEKVLTMLGQITFSSYKTHNLGVKTTIITLQKLELFLCSLEDILKEYKAFKRSVFLPFDLTLKAEIPSIKEGIQKYTVRIENFMAEISYQDIILLRKAFENQLELLKLLRYKAQNPPLPKSLLLEVKAKSLHVLLINDLNNLFSPFLYLKAQTLSLLLMKTPESLSLEASLGLKLDYYNFYASFWEPLIEYYEFLLLLSKSPVLIEINLGPNEQNKPLNLNISTRMIEVLLKALEDLIPQNKPLFKHESKGLLLAEHSISEEKPLKEIINRPSIQISPSISFDKSKSLLWDEENGVLNQRNRSSRHSFLNLTGQRVEVLIPSNEGDLYKSFIVEIEEKLNIFIENALDYKELFSNEKSFERGKGLIQSLKELVIQVRLLSEGFLESKGIYKGDIEKTPKNQGNKLITIEALNLDRVLIKKYHIYEIKNPLSQYSAISKVQYSPKTNTKLLTLTSPLILYNKAYKNLELKLIGVNNLWSLPIDKDFIIPIDFIKGNLLFKIEDSPIWSSQLLLERFLDEKIIGDSIEIKIGLIYLNIDIGISQEYGLLQKALFIRPSIEFLNYLEIPLIIELSSMNTNTSISFIVNPNEPLPLYEHLDKDLEVRIKAEKLLWSKKIGLLKEDFFYNRLLQLQTEEIGELTGISFVFERYCYKYVFYPEVLIYNSTPFELFLCGKNKKGEVLEKHMINSEKKVSFFSEIIEVNRNGKDIILNGLSGQSVEVFIKEDEKLELVIGIKPLKLGKNDYFFIKL